MLQRWQKNLERFFEWFQNRWETSSTFRTTWSLIGVALALVFICGISGLVASGVGAILPSNSQSSAGNNFQQAIGGANPSQSHPIPAYTPGGDGSVPSPIPVATTTVPPPTVTAIPSPLPGTPTATPPPSPTPTGTALASQVQVQAQQNKWVAGQQGTLSNFTTEPQQANATLILVTLDFGFGCTLGNVTQPVGSVTLDANGTDQTTPMTFTVPSCVQGQNDPVTALYQVNGLTGYAQYQASQH